MRNVPSIVWQVLFPLVSGASLLAAGPGKLELKQVYANVETILPVAVVVPPDGTRREFLVLQRGVVVILPEDRDSSEAAVFLDISDRNLIEKAFEEGLLGLAFHPKFAENGKIYVHHSLQNPKQSVISEFAVSKSDPNKADLSSERVLLEVPQPFWNHNSGNLVFGPDGFLYIPFGDGGKRDDPLNNAQNLFMLNGKVLRIDVDGKTGHLEYAIPADNPFVGQEGTRGEIWAYGLRNPWGTWFDPENGDLWLADVGQDIWEEIDLIEKGGNYGWSHREAAHDFALKPNYVAPEGTTFVDPIHEYSHADGLSITGGFIYRGKKLPQLQGYYIYGDFVFGRIWALKYGRDSGKVVENHVIYERENAGPPEKGAVVFKPTAFCEDSEGEVLVLSHEGKVYMLE